MHLLDQFAPATVRCIFALDPSSTVSSLLIWGRTRPDGERIAVCELDPTRPVFDLTDDLVHALAVAALAVWPDWYGNADLFSQCDESSLHAALDQRASGQAAGRHRLVVRPWLSQAITLCRKHAPPVVPGVSPTVQLQQLSLAIASSDLTLVVHIAPGSKPESTGLLALARNLEWLSRHLSARVVAVLPVAWSSRVELDSISWGFQTDEVVKPIRSPAERSLDEPLPTVSPIRGRPHPNSPGEQLLAEHLGRDPILGPLFVYNMPVTTLHGSRYQVDVVWFDGKVAVEIDGYGWHSSRSEFVNDRQRDYELQLSGYLILRLPHDAVMADVELAIDKVRDFVNLRMRPSA